MYNAKQLLFYTFLTQSMSAFPCLGPCTATFICGGKRQQSWEEQEDRSWFIVPQICFRFQFQNIKYLTWFFPLKEDLRCICFACWPFVVWNEYVVTMLLFKSHLSTGFYFVPDHAFDVILLHFSCKETVELDKVHLHWSFQNVPDLTLNSVSEPRYTTTFERTF